MASEDKRQESLGYRIALGGIKGLLRVLLVIAFIVILIFLGRSAYRLGYAVFDEQPVDEGEGRAVTITITDDMSVRQIGMLLRSNGLLTEDPTAFVLQELISEYHGKLLPGTYTLRTSMTADEMFPILAQEQDDAGTGQTSERNTVQSDGTEAGQASDRNMVSSESTESGQEDGR